MALKQNDFSADLCAQLVEQYGTIELAAKAIAPDCETRLGGIPSYNTIKAWISAHVGPMRRMRAALREANDGQGLDLSRPADPERINRIDDLLDRANVPLEAVGSIISTKLKAYSGFLKNAEGEPVRVPMYSTSVTIAPPIPDFPVLTPSPPVIITFNEAPRILRKTSVAVVYSDAQIGFLRDTENGELEEIHDSRALDVAEQITADVDPDEQDWIGDWMDWTELSRWPKHPEMRACLQPSVDAGGYWLGRLCAASRPTKKRTIKRKMIGSNHGDRPELSMMAYNMEAVGLKRSEWLRASDEWPVHSEGFLLGYNELGIDFSGRYPGGEYYLTPDLVLIHAPPKKADFRASVIHGHTHKLSRSTSVTHGHSGRDTHFMYDIGCMCQLGTTSNARRLMVTRVPSDRGRTNWAQGIAIVEIVEPSGSRPGFHSVEQVAIHEGGWASFRGKVYESRPVASAA